MIEIWGLKNCDTCRKALKWLAAEGIDHRFRDVRADGLDAGRLDDWLGELGREALINRRSTTWRQLDESERAGLDDARAKALLLAHPTLMKRPVFDLGGRRLVGFGLRIQAAISDNG